MLRPAFLCGVWPYFRAEAGLPVRAQPPRARTMCPSLCGKLDPKDPTAALMCLRYVTLPTLVKISL